MKKTLLLPLLMIVLVLSATAQDGKLPFQGKLTTGGIPVTGSRTFEFSIPSIGWTETHEAVAILDGYYSVILGSTEANGLPDGLFDGVSEVALNITVDGTVLSPITLYAPLRQKVSIPVNLTTTGADTSFVVNLTGESTGAAAAIQAKSSTTGTNYAVVGEIEESLDNGNDQYAIFGDASGLGSGLHIGVIGGAYDLNATGGNRYGIYGQAASKAKYNYGSYGFANGTGNGDAGEGYGVGSINFGAYGRATGNEWSNTGMEGYATGSNGALNYGFHGLSDAGTADTVRNYGVAGRAFGPGVNYGIYGAGFDGVENWAGWFDGDVNINGQLLINGTPMGGEGGFTTDTIKAKDVQLLRDNGEKAIELRYSEVQGGKGLFTYDVAGNSPPAGWFGNDGQDRGFVQLVDWTNQTGALLTGFWTGMPSYYLEDWNAQWRALLTMDSVGNIGTGGTLRLNGQLGEGQKEFFNIHLTTDSEGSDPVRATSEMFLHGPSTPNFQLGGKPWENGDLPVFRMFGSHDDGGGWFQSNLNIDVFDVFGDGTLNSANIAIFNSQGAGVSHESVLLTGAGQNNAGQLNLRDNTGTVDLVFLHDDGSVGGAVEVQNYDFSNRVAMKPNGITFGTNTFSDGINIAFDSSNPIMEMYSGSVRTVFLDGVGGNIDITGAYLNTSDGRLKTNIETLDNALENTRKLRGVSYNWKDTERSNRGQIGVIAQEVEEVYPEFVHTDEEGMKAVNYSQMVAVLIEAIKELDAKVVSLEAENAKLKAELTEAQQNEIDDLRGEIEQIKALLVKPTNDNATVGSVSNK